MNKLSEGKVKLIIVSSLLAICVMFVIVIIIMNKEQKKEKIIEFNNISDYSTYFFVQKNMNNFLNNLSISSNDYVYNLLNEKYVEENNISIENSLYDKELVNTNTTYNIRIDSLKTYELNKDNNIILYDLEGDVYDTGFELYKYIVRRRFILLVDYNRKTYNVYPIKRNVSNKDIISKFKKQNSIQNNNYNKLETISVITENMICMTYYYDLYNLVLNDKVKAIKIIQNIDNTKELEKLIKDNSFFGNVNACSSSGDIVGEKVYYVVDENSTKYTFRENGVMNYKVTIN